MIEFRNATIGIAEKTLVRDIEAQIAPGKFVAVLGANGAGKTTLLRTICGFARLRAGEIRLDGTPVAALTGRERARLLAFVTTDDALTDALTVRDVVSIGRFAHHRWWQWRSSPEDETAVDRALCAVRMDAYGARLFATLSSGERQRVWIAMGVAQRTPILLLDEPTSHLDVRVAHEILALLRELARSGTTILCVLHDLNDAAAYADELMLLGAESMLAFGAPRNVLRPDLVERAYGIAMHAIPTEHGIRIFPVAT
ncbi:MAG: ABC transporter ATP-binding protein [Candidatus Eremiobacteraeota bacterium]|nr:ABC transporter ATP-binding protein [Candidatus Eremiobacteraeota bacterium]